MSIGRILILALAVTTPVTAWSQTQTQAPPVASESGFTLQTPNGDYRLQLGGIVQVDGRFVLDDVKPVTNTFSIRKARINLVGRVAKYFDFRLMPDFGNGTTALLDAYFDTRFSQKVRLRVGKDKSPVGHEVLVSDGALVFPERALPSSLLPNRDVGIQLQGDLAGGKVFYAGGVLNGIVDGTNSTGDVDTNNGKDLAGRIVVQPFRQTGQAAAVLSGFGFQVGGSEGKQVGALPVFRTSVGQTYFSYAPAGSGAPAAVADGARSRVTPAVFYYQKTFGVFAEYVRSTQAVSRGGPARDISNRAWDVTGIFNLTGEAAGPALVNPKRQFDPATDKWGALQAAVRYAELDVDDAAFDAGFAAPGASGHAQQFTVGVNWYPNIFIKWYANYERTAFDRNAPGARPTEHVFFFRAQLSY